MPCPLLPATVGLLQTRLTTDVTNNLILPPRMPHGAGMLYFVQQDAATRSRCSAAVTAVRS